MKRRVTIITPVYNEEDSLPLYVETVRNVLLERSDVEFDVLLVDDGSSDRSWELIERACAADARFRGLRLSRNFGAHIALCAGFDAARADAVAILACDLQDPPETVLEFVAKWRAGADIVWGHRRERDDLLWRRLVSRLFEGAMRRYAMPRGSRFTTGSFLLADRKVVEAVQHMREHSRITFALVAWTGFRQEIVHYDRMRRRGGRSGWTFWRMVLAMYDAFVGFSLLPIRLTTALGIAVSLLNVPLAVYLVTRWLLGNPLPGYTSVMLVLTVFFGIQFLLMGLIGEYLYRIYLEAVQRPLYFVSHRCGADAGQAPESGPRLLQQQVGARQARDDVQGA
ncbi:MAG TPA: glycosyltransferase family 2 protein [Burkholderiales bacterium]|nr:glycosyltransferase family 2 protein [Burkholderiales bacterium]